MSQFDLIVFDWDGTLVDSTGVIADSLRAAAADLDLPIPSRELASHVIGLGMREMVSITLPSMAPDRLPELVARYRVHFTAREHETVAFKGIPALLRELAQDGHRLAIATGKSRKGLDRALEQQGWGPLFHDTRCADEGIPKPDPWMLTELCRTQGVSPARTVMIGDTTHDLRMARAAGAAAVAVTYGAHSKDQLLGFGAQGCTDSVEALRNWLRAHLARGARAAGAEAGGERQSSD